MSTSLTTEFKDALIKQMEQATTGDAYQAPPDLTDPDPDAPPVRTRAGGGNQPHASES